MLQKLSKDLIERFSRKETVNERKILQKVPLSVGYQMTCPAPENHDIDLQNLIYWSGLY